MVSDQKQTSLREKWDSDMASFMFIWFLVFAIAVNGIIHKSTDRVMICLVLLIATSFHFVAFNHSYGLEYYGSAAILHLVINWFLDRFDNSWFSSDVIIINYVFLLLQCFGFVCYVADVSEIPYNTLVIVLAVIELLRLITRTGRDKEDDERRDYYRRHGVFGSNLSGNADGTEGS